MGIRILPGGNKQSVATPGISFGSGNTAGEKFVETVTRNRSGGGGGGGSSGSSNAAAQAAAKAAADAEQQRQAEQRRVAEQQRAIEERTARDTAILEQRKQTQQVAAVIAQRNAEVEYNRIQKETTSLLQSGGQQRVQTFRDSKTGAPIQVTTTYSSKSNTGGRRVFETKNLETGEINIRTYAPGDKGGGAKLTGGITTNADYVAQRATPAEDKSYKLIKNTDLEPYQISQPILIPAMEKNFGTAMDSSVPIRADIKFEPYIEKRIIDETKDSFGRTVPITTLVYVDPTGLGSQKERPVTKEEREFYKENSGERDLVVVPKKTTIQKITGGASNIYSNINLKLKESITDPIGRGSGIIFSSLGGPKTLDEARLNSQETTEFLNTNIDKTFADKKYDTSIIKEYALGQGTDITLKSDYKLIDNSRIRDTLKLGTATGEFVSGVGVGVTRDVLDNPFKQVLIVGAGFGLGAVTEAGSLAASSISTRAASAGGVIGKVGSFALPAYQTGVNIVGAGAGLVFLGKTTTDISAADSAFDKGVITGKASKDIILFGAGAYAGSRSALKGYDFLKTRNRVELPIEDIGLVTISEVLSGNKRFVESSQFGGSNTAGVAKQKFDLKIFERAGRSYSATPNKFYNKKFTTIEGSSEFAGLYVAPSPSVYFLKAGGESPSLVGIFRGGGKPALAQIYGKGFTTKQGVPGKGFVSGIKPEIEAIFAPGQQFIKTGSDTFFKYNGRKIPTDSFRYVDSPVVELPLTSGRSISSSYSSYTSSGEIISPVTISASGFSSTSSYKPSPTSVVYSTPTTSSSSSGGRSSSPSITTSGSSGRSSGGGSGSIGSSSGKISSSPSIVSSVSPSSPSSYKPSPVKTSYSPSYSPSRGYGGSSSGYSQSRAPISGKPAGFYLPKPRKFKGGGSFGVQIRRGGKFFNIGNFRTQAQAFERGRDVTSKTLAATFRLTGKGKAPKKLKGFYTKKSKEGTLFIEKKQFRLSKTPEVKEIQMFKSGKGGIL